MNKTVIQSINEVITELMDKVMEKVLVTDPFIPEKQAAGQLPAPAAGEAPAAQHPLNGLSASFCRTPAAYPGTGPDPCRDPGSHKDLPHPMDGSADPKQPAQTH